MGAGARVAQKRADLIGSFGREDVFELAGLLLNFGFAVERETVGEEALGEAVAANDVGGFLTASICEFNNGAAIPDGTHTRLERVVTGIHKGPVIVSLGRMGSGVH